jgi:DNA-binding SARP family transcriptional activator
VLRVTVLGRIGVERDGVELPTPSSRRAWSLLAHLALHPGPQSRGEHAARFWPDVLDSSARASLRSAIWSLRKALGPHAEELVLAGRDDVALAHDELWVDALQFQHLIDQGRDAEAVALCHGELLAGFDDEWILSARDEHRERLLKALERLACECDAAGDSDRAIEWSRRQVASDPFGEDAHRRLIARLAQSGDRAAALLAYRSLADRLRRELSVAPSPLTRQLVDGLRAEPSAAPAQRAPANLLVLVGRSHELDRLTRAWQTAADGRGGVVTLTGEAGVGKTRLASELLARAGADGAATASCAALDLGGAAPFGMWAELIREMLGATPQPKPDAVWPQDLSLLIPDIHARFELAATERTPASPELERARLLEAVVALVEWAARARPLALLLEDLHISDGASLELTGYVARRLAGLPVLLVLTRRERPRRVEVDTLENALRSRGLMHAELVLGPLQPAYVADLARSAAHLEDDDVQRVVKAAEGNALLAVEMARALARGEHELSAGLRGAVAGAFGALGDDARSFVEIAAVAARELEPHEIATLPIHDPAQAATEALESGMFVARERRIGFRHALLRETLYTELPDPRRVQLHHAWAQILIGHGDSGAQRAAELARHLRLAERHDEAVQQLALAAVDARALAALHEAAGYLREALTIAPQRADLLLELAEVEAWRGRRAEAEHSFGLAIELLADAGPLERARAWLRCARWYHGPICVPALVRDCCAKALAELNAVTEPATPERREALAALAWAEAVAGSVQEAERLLAELHTLTAGQPPDDLATYDVAHARALAAVRREDFQGSYAPSIAAGDAIVRAGRPDLAYGCWANAAGAAAAAGDLPRALAFLDRLGEVLAGNGLAPLEIQLLAMRSFLLMRSDDLHGACLAADAAVELAELIDDPQLSAAAAHDRGIVALAQGDAALAETLLASALVKDAPISPSLTRLARAEALARLGRIEEAEGEVRATTLEPLRPSDWPETLVPRLARVQGLIAWSAGDRTLAAKRLTEAADGWRRQLSRLSRGERMAAVLADLGRPVVGLIEPERELERVQHELDLLQTHHQGAPHAVLP